MEIRNKGNNQNLSLMTTFFIESQNYKVEKDLKDHLDPIPLLRAGNFPADQVTKRPIQPGLKHFPKWGIHKFWATVPHDCHSEKFFSDV